MQYLNLIIFTVFVLFTVVSTISTRESKAKKGHFFVHTLHSASIFNTTVPVKWSATLKDRPALPQWLHLVKSRHSALAYLIGTPVTTALQLTVHVLAKRLDNFQSEQQYIVISIAENELYTKSTVQVIDILIKNYDAEELITGRMGMIGHLEKAATNTFRGKSVNPYIFDIRPEIPTEKQHLFRNRKVGSIVSIGTQRGFYPNVFSMVENLQSNPHFCRKNSQIAMNRYFSPMFVVDWCQTKIYNRRSSSDVTATKSLPALDNSNEASVITTENEVRPPDHPPREISADEGGFSFWESVLVFPLIAVTCILLVLILSLIFFGKREGQQWRDYKTPKDTLEEYVSVRESQRHLRELSVQRQLLLMNRGREHSTAPSGIHSFLQPRSLPPTSVSGSTRLSKSASRLNEAVAYSAGEDNMDVGESSENVPVGKQTVAEAAKQCGSSLHLYRNPLESETDGENDSDSLEDN